MNQSKSHHLHPYNESAACLGTSIIFLIIKFVSYFGGMGLNHVQ